MSAVRIKRLQDILEANPVPTIITRMRDGMVKYANGPIADLFGGERSQVVGQVTPDYFVYPEERDVLMRELKEKGYVKDREILCKKLDGSPFWARVSLRALDFENEPSVMATVHDVNEQKEALEALRISEKKYRALIEHCNDAIFIADAESGAIVEANHKAEELTGLPRESLIGMHQSELHPPEDAGLYREHFRERAIRGQVSNDDILIQHSDGRKIPVNVSATPIETDGKKWVFGVFRDVSERADFELQIRKFRSLLDQSLDALYVLDPESGRFLDVNETACRRLGYTRRELLGMHVMDVSAHIPDIETWRKMTASLGSANDLLEPPMDGVHICRDGRRFPVEVAARYVRDAGEDRIIAIARDVTVRMRHERQLSVLARAGSLIHESLDEQAISRRLVELAAEMLDCMGGAVGFVRDGTVCFREYWQDGSFHAVNLDFPENRGVPGHVLHKRAPYFTNDAEHDAHVISGIRQRLGFKKLVNIPVLNADGEVEACFEMHDRRDGQDFDARDVEALRTLAAVVSTAFSNARLVADLRAAREKLLAGNRMLRLIGECNLALVRVGDEDDFVRTVCSLLVEEGGYVMVWMGEAVFDDAQSVRPRVWAGMEDQYLQSIRISWGDNEFGQGPTGRAIREGRPVVCQDVRNHPALAPWREEAERRGYAASAALPLRVDGVVVGALNIYAARAYAFDATELRLLEELALDIGFGLEVLRNRQSRKALEAQFIQAQKMEALGTLVGGIAHDFNNLLAGIMGNAFLLKKYGEGNAAMLKKIARIESACATAADTIRQLLTFARGEGAERKVFSLRPLVKETCKLMRAGLPENIRCVVECCECPALVNGDAAQIKQALVNMITNAMHALEGVEDARISVLLDCVDVDGEMHARHGDLQAGRYARLRICDNGCGIEDEHLDRIFEPFFTTREEGQGSGLGLSMSYGSICAHGGIIDVDSRVGHGATFDIWLPLHADENDAGEKVVSEMPAVGGGQAILVADDEASVLEAMCEVLESLGYRTLAASDGRKAVETFLRYRDEIALVLTDVVMPEMSGRAAVEEIRRHAPAAPVIFMSGYDRDEVLHGMDMSYCDVLHKPVTPAELSRMIRRMLDGGRNAESQ